METAVPDPKDSALHNSVMENLTAIIPRQNFLVETIPVASLIPHERPQLPQPP
jgi:hypothetical protein